MPRTLRARIQSTEEIGRSLIAHLLRMSLLYIFLVMGETVDALAAALERVPRGISAAIVFSLSDGCVRG